jgi:hypothetical protein
VRATSKPHFDTCASVVHTFCPLTIHSSPSRTARVASDATSEPAPGSLNSWHQMSSPVKMRRRKRWCISSVPWASRTGAAMPMPIGLSPMSS